jgi:tRNA threonylcarbamoyladenosine biosynthesis protein TsaE
MANSVDPLKLPPSGLCLPLPNPEATQALGQQLGKTLAAGSVLLLHGDLGAGKTTFVQGLGIGLGIADLVDSPTFTLVNEYLGGRVPLYHFDLYRLSPPEVATLALETYWEGVEIEPGIVAIEWAERLPYLPPQYLALQFSQPQDSDRGVQVRRVEE